jgi:hypothetical protein
MKSERSYIGLFSSFSTAQDMQDLRQDRTLDPGPHTDHDLGNMIPGRGGSADFVSRVVPAEAGTQKQMKITNFIGDYVPNLGASYLI